MLFIQNYFKNSDRKKTASTPCRYLLKQIKGHIYVANDKNVLEDVEERLEKILQFMISYCLSGFGFLVNSFLENPSMQNDQVPVMKNCHIPDFENQHLLGTLVASMSGESLIVKYP